MTIALVLLVSIPYRQGISEGFDGFDPKEFCVSIPYRQGISLRTMESYGYTNTFVSIPYRQGIRQRQRRQAWKPNVSIPYRQGISELQDGLLFGNQYQFLIGKVSDMRIMGFVGRAIRINSL